MIVSLFVATPLHDSRMHKAYTQGLLEAWGATIAQKWCTQNGTSLARQRDQLVARFAESDCTHLLFVDSDIGWHAADAMRLVETGKDFIGGFYIRKGPGNVPTARLEPFRQGELYGARHLGTGFLLVSRRAVESLLEAHRSDRYQYGDREFISLFSQRLDEDTEDVAFCRRYRELGGALWVHTGVTLDHYDGGTAYRPDVSELRAHLTTEQAAAE